LLGGRGRRPFIGFRDDAVYISKEKHGVTGKIKRCLKLPRGRRTRNRSRHERWLAQKQAVEGPRRRLLQGTGPEPKGATSGDLPTS